MFRLLGLCAIRIIYIMRGGNVVNAKSRQYLEICLVFIAVLIVVMIAPLLVSLAESNPTKMLIKY